ncbi:MAG: transposase [Deltaproteobacteria bacterium]|nr:transposase [Deltaproteobacteria bacterium]
MTVRRSGHWVYQTRYHIVVQVKYRRALLVPEIEGEIVRIGGEIGVRYEIEFEKMECDTNHFHPLEGLTCPAAPPPGTSSSTRFAGARTLSSPHPPPPAKPVEPPPHARCARWGTSSSTRFAGARTRSSPHPNPAAQ